MSASSTGLDRPPASTGRRVGASPLVLLVTGQLITGVLIGLIWLHWSPRAVSYLLSNGDGGSLVIPAEGEAQVAGDGRYVVLTVAAGLLFSLAAWQLRRLRGPLALAVLGTGSLASSLLAFGTGRLLSAGTGSVPINSSFHPRLTLHATSALWLQALVAVLVYTALVGLSGDPGLGRLADAPSDGLGQPASPLGQPADNYPGATAPLHPDR